VLDLLKAAGDRIDRELGSDPEMAAELHHALGNTYRARGLFDDAQPHFAAALDLRRQVFGATDPQLAESVFFFGANQANLNHFEVAEQYYRDAIAIERRQPFANATLLPYILLDLSALLPRHGDLTGAERLCAEALDLFVRHLGPDHVTVAFTKQELGLVQLDRGNAVGARRLFEEALAIFRKQSASPESESGVLEGLASVFKQEGNLVEAERLSREVVERRTTALGADHATTLASDLQLAGTLFMAGKHAEASRRAERIIAVQRRQRQTGRPIFSSALILAGTLTAGRNPRAAESLILEALRLADHLPTTERCPAGQIRKEAADWFISQHRRGEAGLLLERAFDDIQTACGRDGASYREVMKAMATFPQSERRR
jgi:tetratricopeptide (TPR) repeat protein